VSSDSSLEIGRVPPTISLRVVVSPSCVVVRLSMLGQLQVQRVELGLLAAGEQAGRHADLRDPAFDVPGPPGGDVHPPLGIGDHFVDGSQSSPQSVQLRRHPSRLLVDGDVGANLLQTPRHLRDLLLQGEGQPVGDALRADLLAVSVGQRGDGDVPDSLDETRIEARLA